MYVFAGTDRRNASLIVEQNASLSLGAPVRVPITSGAIVVLQVANGQTTGSAQFSYKVVGTKYNWYEKAFLNKSKKVYRLFLVSLWVAFLIVICVPLSLLAVCIYFLRKKLKRVPVSDNQVQPKKTIKPKPLKSFGGLELEEETNINFSA